MKMDCEFWIMKIFIRHPSNHPIWHFNWTFSSLLIHSTQYGHFPSHNLYFSVLTTFSIIGILYVLSDYHVLGLVNILYSLDYS